MQEKIYIRQSRKDKRMKKRQKVNIAVALVITLISIVIFLINNQDIYGFSKDLTIPQKETTKQKIVLASNKTEDKKVKTTTEKKEDAAKKKEANKKLDQILEENERLKQHNKNLEEDNISLQNSLKIAAAVGIKPRNYTKAPEITSRGNINRRNYLGKFKVTAYTPCATECGNNKGITYSGKPIVPGVSVAVDTRYWPIGTVFYVKGLGYVTAMDTGSAIKGKKRFDFAVFDRKFAFALGTREWDVYLVKIGNGKV